MTKEKSLGGTGDGVRFQAKYAFFRKDNQESGRFALKSHPRHGVWGTDQYEHKLKCIFPL
jgi:hypothetical protein